MDPNNNNGTGALGGLVPGSTLPTTNLPRVNSALSDLDAQTQSVRPLVSGHYDSGRSVSPAAAGVPGDPGGRAPYSISDKGLKIFRGFGKNKLSSPSLSPMMGQRSAAGGMQALQISTSVNPSSVVAAPQTSRGQLESVKGKGAAASGDYNDDDTGPGSLTQPLVGAGRSLDDSDAGMKSKNLAGDRGSTGEKWVHNNLVQKDHEVLRMTWEEGIRLFNEKPNKGVAYLAEKNLIQLVPKQVASLLHDTPELNILKIGDYLGQISNPFNLKVMQAYVDMVDFRLLSFDDALRVFLGKFKLPGEAPIIDKMMEAFARHYCESNPDTFGHEDTAYVLAFATIMLNTDAHSKNVKKKMTKAEFVKNYKRINEKDVIGLTQEFLETLYDNIVKNEIKMISTGVDQVSENDVLDMLKQGATFNKYPYGKRGKPSPRIVWLSDDLTKVSWRKATDKGKPKVLYLHEITACHAGQYTAAFEKSHVAGTKDDHCFSLISKRRSLDLEAYSKGQRDMWLNYFNQVVERNLLERRAMEFTRRHAHREHRLSSAKVRWNEDVIPNWKDWQGSKRLRQLWWAGIPPSIRPKVWPLAICTRVEISEEQYKHYMQLGQQTRAATDGPSKALMEVVQADIDQTFPDLSFFHDSGPLCAPLVEVVTAYHAYANAAEVTGAGSGYKIEYLNGITYLTAMLLLYMDQRDTFVCLVNLLDSPFFQMFLVRDVAKIQDTVDGFEAKLAVDFPIVFQKFRALEIKTIEFLRPWYVTLMSEALPLDTATRVFDCFLLDGEQLLVRAALAAIRTLQTAIDCMDDRGEVMGILRRMPMDVSEETLFNNINFVDGRTPRLSRSGAVRRESQDFHTDEDASEAGTPSSSTSIDALTDRSVRAGTGAQSRELLFEQTRK